MSAAASATASAPASTKRAPGRPFRPGRSPNPGGKLSAGKRYQELRAGIIGSIDGELSGLDEIAVDQIVQQLLRAERTKDAAESARCSRTAQLWLKNLQARRAKREPSGPTLAEYLAQRGRADEDELDPRSASPVADDAIPAPPVRKRSAVRTRSTAGREETNE